MKSSFYSVGQQIDSSYVNREKSNAVPPEYLDSDSDCEEGYDITVKAASIKGARSLNFNFKV